LPRDISVRRKKIKLRQAIGHAERTKISAQTSPADSGKMSNFPFSEQKIAKNVFLREFKDSVDPEELIWHQDREDREVRVVKSDGWKLQRDNELPVTLQEGHSYHIRSYEFHRVLKGTGPLVIKIVKEKARI